MLPIDEEDRRYALHAAAGNLIAYIERGIRVGHRADSPSLLQRRGSFVTLRDRETGRLRGCRGEFRASSPLIESLIEQAINAATDDPRFPAVSREEIPGLTLRISALTSIKPIGTDEIVLGRHGLIVVQGAGSGLLLPEVPRHFELRTVQEFLAAVLRKAGLSGAQFANGDVELYGFETIAWGDDDED